MQIEALSLRGDRKELIHARGIESPEAATIGALELQFVRASPRVLAGKTSHQLVRLGAAPGNRPLVAETPRRTCRCIACHGHRIRW